MAAAATDVLRRGWEDGRRVHGAFALPFDAFARRVRALTGRRLARAGAPATAAEIDEAAGRAALADLYLACACEAGDDAAWARFTSAYGSTLIALAIRRSASRTDAEQIAEELPGELFAPPPSGAARTRLGTYDGAGSLTGWLAVIVERRLADRRRASARERPAAEAEEVAEAPGPGQDASEHAAAAETRARFGAALREGWKELTPRESLVLVLRYRDDLPQKDIARILAVGEPRVSRIVSTASEKLRASVLRRLGGAEGNEPGPAWDALVRTVAESLATLPGSPDSSAHG